MNIIKVSEGKYINLDRITYIETKRNGKVIVHFAVGGGDWVDAACTLKLDQDEAAKVLNWLDNPN
mgnify:CR=1 FL=1